MATKPTKPVSTQAKINKANAAAKGAERTVKDNNKNRVGAVSTPSRGVRVVTSPASRAADARRLSDVSKTAGRAQNVASKAKAKIKDSGIKPMARDSKGRETIASVTKSVPAVKNALAKMASKKPSAMGQSAKSHQKNLANISGAVAENKTNKKLAADPKKNKDIRAVAAAGVKARYKTLETFKKSK